MSEGNGKKPEKAKRNFSPETRQKLSELAKERHARGELGGAKYGRMGGRPRTRNDRVAKKVAEAAQEEENRKKIIQVFEDAVDRGQPVGLRLKAAEAWVKIDQSEGKLALQEEESDYKQMSREQIMEDLTSFLTQRTTTEMLRKHIEGDEGVVDAEVVEDGDEPG